MKWLLWRVDYLLFIKSYKICEKIIHGWKLQENVYSNRNTEEVQEAILYLFLVKSKAYVKEYVEFKEE